MKKCNICDTDKEDSEFYKGLKQCKPCYIAKVKNYRSKNIEKVRAYDRKRGNRQAPGYLKEYRSNFPKKYRATNMVNNAIRDGKLFKEPCEVCGREEFVHAHHDDYAKPLNIRWLCAAHHQQWHAEHGEAKNAK